MLKHFKNFKQYYPTVEDRPDYADLIAAGVGFEMDEEGRDWYDLRDTLQKDTFKVVYYPDGTVLQCEKDVNELCPHGMAGVVELEEVPDGLRRDTTFKYRFNGENVELNPSYFEGAKEYKLSVASRKVAEYRDLLELGAKVSNQLDAWREYRLAVFNTDLSDLENIVWPKLPE